MHPPPPLEIRARNNPEKKGKEEKKKTKKTYRMSCTHKGKIEREYFYQKNRKLLQNFVNCIVFQMHILSVLPIFFLYQIVANIIMRTYGVNQELRFAEGICLHRKSLQIRFKKNFFLHHTCAICSEQPSHIKTMVKKHVGAMGVAAGQSGLIQYIDY